MTPARNGQNPKDRVAACKPDLSLVPPAAMIYTALAMENGAAKYGAFNWRGNKVLARVYVAAALRHVLTWLDGEEKADDSGVPHLAHALASLAILVDALETGNLIDDRPRSGAAARLLTARPKRRPPRPRSRRKRKMP